MRKVPSVYFWVNFGNLLNPQIIFSFSLRKIFARKNLRVQSKSYILLSGNVL
jgi:hypothetical protein